MMLLGYLLLFAASIVCAYCTFQRKEQKGPAVNAFYVLSLGSISIALSMLGTLTLDPGHPDTGTLLRMLNNLAVYAGAPMMVTALLSYSLDKPISLPGWGRWLLGLFAFFELLRRMGYGEAYLLALIALTLLGIALTVTRLKRSFERATMTGVLIATSVMALLYLQTQFIWISFAGAAALLLLSCFSYPTRYLTKAESNNSPSSKSER